MGPPCRRRGGAASMRFLRPSGRSWPPSLATSWTRPASGSTFPRCSLRTSRGAPAPFTSMVQAGMEIERAAALSGLLADAGAGEYTLRRGRLTARLFPTPSGCYLERQRRNCATDGINCPAQWWGISWKSRVCYLFNWFSPNPTPSATLSSIAVSLRLIKSRCKPVRPVAGVFCVLASS